MRKHRPYLEMFRVIVKGVEGFHLRWKYPNGDYGVSFHPTKRGVLVAFANRYRAIVKAGGRIPKCPY